MSAPAPSIEQLREFQGELYHYRDLLCARDPQRWLETEVVTRDEASQQVLPWPKTEYLAELLRVMREEQKLAIPKSRRMMVSWLAAAHAVWLARYYKNHVIFVVSETESKAAFLVNDRCAFIEDNLVTPALRREYSAIRTSEGQIGKMTYKETGSTIWALASGSDVLRTFTPSRVILDELDFQSDGAETLGSAMHFVEKRATICVISTSNGPGKPLAKIAKSVGFTRWAE